MSGFSLYRRAQPTPGPQEPVIPARGFRNPGSHYLGAQLQFAASRWAHNKLCRPTSGLLAGGQAGGRAALGPHWAISQGV